MEAKVMIVTGASRGLGAAAAGLAARMGARVVLNARSREALEGIARKINNEGNGEAIIVQGDVSRQEDCRRMVEETVNAFGRIDSVVNNAGVIEPVAPLAEGQADSWQYNWSVNLLGPVMLTQVALPYLREQSGRVINVSSGAAVSPVPGWGAYCTAKAALNMFNAVLAREEGAVTTIAFRPGVVDTEMQATIRREGAQGMQATDYERFLNYHQRGELVAPEQPGLALAVLALHAPGDWSGEFISWREERVQALVDRFSR